MWSLFIVDNKDTKTTSLTSFWCLYCQLWNDFTHCSGASIVELEQVNVCGVTLTVTALHFFFELKNQNQADIFIWKSNLSKYPIKTWKQLQSTYTLRDKCPNTEFSMVRIFLYSAHVFSCEFWDIFQSTFFVEHLWKVASEVIFCNYDFMLSPLMKESTACVKDYINSPVNEKI